MFHKYNIMNTTIMRVFRIINNNTINFAKTTKQRKAVHKPCKKYINIMNMTIATVFQDHL